MKIISASDAHVENKLVRTFTVMTDKRTTKQALRHKLHVHTKFGPVDAAILVEADKMFHDLGEVLHVAHAHHREWKVWVVVK